MSEVGYVEFGFIIKEYEPCDRDSMLSTNTEYVVVSFQRQFSAELRRKPQPKLSLSHHRGWKPPLHNEPKVAQKNKQPRTVSAETFLTCKGHNALTLPRGQLRRSIRWRIVHAVRMRLVGSLTSRLG